MTKREANGHVKRHTDRQTKSGASRQMKRQKSKYANKEEKIHAPQPTHIAYSRRAQAKQIRAYQNKCINTNSKGSFFSPKVNSHPKIYYFDIVFFFCKHKI